MDEEIPHVGKLIKTKMDEEGRKASWLADKIGCVPNHIYWIYKQQYIGPEQLISICIHLETNFFSCYSKYIHQQVQLPERLYCVDDKIHIGNLIQGKMNKDGRKAPWLARKIKRSRGHIYRIYGYSHIDVKKLFSICIHLETDFFAYYSDYVQKKSKKNATNRNILCNNLAQYLL
jgi:hypothetical protein